MNVNGRTGLDILVQTWCENAETFQGFWPTRTSTLGLIQLFIAERPSLQQLQVKGDIIVNPATKDGEFLLLLFGICRVDVVLNNGCCVLV
jgi:importin-9